MSTLEIPVVAAAAAAPGQVPVAVAVAVPQAAAVSAAPAGAVSHWSKVHLGAKFLVEVAPTSDWKETRRMTLQLRRHPATGFSESLEELWKWAPNKPRADSLQMLLQSVSPCDHESMIITDYR